MARSHGKILVDIWLDPDFLALTADAQWAYFMLLSQPGLNLVGAIDYRPNRWRFGNGMTTSDVEARIKALEAAQFVLVDHDTEELLVRSMTRHDGLRTNNSKLMKGLWTAWKSVASMRLRQVAIDNMPPHLFEAVDTPKAALDMRMSGRMNRPNDWAIDCQNGPPSAFRRPPSAVPQSAGQSSSAVESPLPPEQVDTNLVHIAAIKNSRQTAASGKGATEGTGS